MLPQLYTTVLGVALLCVTQPAFVSAQTALPVGPGSDLAYAKCQPCHAMNVVLQSAGISRAMWLGVMEEMEAFGMKVTPEEHQALVDYLATYLGPDAPPAKSKAAAPFSSEADGALLFDRHCSACHGKDGKGASEQMPPLAGNLYLFKDSRYTIAVLVHGLQGPIAIKGRTYGGVMPGFAHLDDAEIAAIADYTLTAWGNRSLSSPDFEPPTIELVKSIRAEGLTAEQMARRRRALR